MLPEDCDSGNGDSREIRLGRRYSRHRLNVGCVYQTNQDFHKIFSLDLIRGYKILVL